MATKEMVFNITGGGSREDLRDSFGSRAGSRMKMGFHTLLQGDVDTQELRNLLFPNPEVDIKLVFPMIIVATINGAEWENSSGESFNLKGFAEFAQDGHTNPRSYKFEGYYHTKKRTGTMTIFVPVL